LKAFPSDVKLSCGKDPLLCHYRATCFTDYTPRHSNISLEQILVGSTKWTKSPGLVDNHQHRVSEDLESRPCYVSHHGSKDGEIYFQVTIPEDPIEFHTVLICGYKIADHKEGGGIFGHVEIKVDLSVNNSDHATVRGQREGKGKRNRDSAEADGYIPSDKRVVWSTRVRVSSYCEVLKFLPSGTHIIGLESKEKKPTGLSHVITWAHW
jgi:hypothetical protein